MIFPAAGRREDARYKPDSGFPPRRVSSSLMRIAPRVSPRVADSPLCAIRSARGNAVGFAFLEPGWIVTARHVVAGQPRDQPLELAFRQGLLPARVLFEHPRVDLAVLEAPGAPPCSPLRPGDDAPEAGGLLCLGLDSGPSTPRVDAIDWHQRTVRHRDGHEEVLFHFPAPRGETARSGSPVLAPGGGVIAVVADGITLGGRRMIRATSIMALLEDRGWERPRP